jgi:protein phosphatase PTC7
MVKFRTAQLEHEFGCPYQLGHHSHANRVSDADLAALSVTSGDTIIMGSDGLLDNMSELEVVSEVSRLVAQGARPAAMAQRIAKVAFDNSLDKRRMTPYSRAATEAFNMVYSGGKPDDITVVVAVIS